MEFIDLGKSCDYAKNDAIKPGMLTLHELGELIRRQGLELIEGANCGQQAVDKDSDSLGNIKCKFKAVLLYQVRKDTHLKLSDNIEKEFKKLKKKRITLWKDTELMEDELKLFKQSFQAGS